MTSDPETPSRPERSSTATGIVALQDADTEIDRLRHRLERVPERERLASATEEMRTWETTRTSMRSRMDELSEIVERSEAEAVDLTGNKQRLEAQLKTVIAPREAEALMHEISTLDEQRDEVETREIEALEEQATLDDRLTEHLATEGAHRQTMASADEALSEVVAEIDGQITAITTRREAARGELSDGWLARYDRIRKASGVAVAELNGRRCSGCHLDLSAAEVDEVRAEAAANDGVADCPQCGRMLLV